MDFQNSDIEFQALKLDEETRARLAVTLIRSLDEDKTLSPDAIESLWLNEAEDRLRRLESGEDPGVDLAAAVAEARKNLLS